MGILPGVSEHPTQGVRAESADAIMQAINEGAYLVAQRENWRALYCRMDKFADEVTGRHWVAGDMVFMDEAANDLALGSNRFTGDLDRVDEVTHDGAGRHWVAGDMVFMDEAADDLALGSNRFTGGLDRVDKFADQATEMETGIWHDDFPFLKVRVPVVN